MTAAAEPASLFPEPERVELLVGPWAKSWGGWSYGLFGEDEPHLVIAGWADAAGVAEVFKAAGIEFDPDDYQPLHLWARELSKCHKHEKPSADCVWCREILPNEPWLLWGSAEDVDEHRDVPGAFRVTVIDLEG